MTMRNDEDDYAEAGECTPLLSPSTTTHMLPSPSTTTSHRNSPSPPPANCHHSFHKQLASSVSLRLENTGSVARDHLASERTFLAWVRTSLAVASTGVALVQLLSISNATEIAKQYARPLGATTVALGMALLAIGCYRYFSIQQALVQGLFPVARVVIVGVSLGLGALIIAVFAVLLNALL